MPSRPAPAPLLVLFDIDGTLLRRSGPHHRECLVEAVRRTTGLESTTDHIPVHGMLDRDILVWMLRDAGASADLITSSMPEVVRAAQAIYVRRCPDLRAKVCPGVRRFLAALGRAGARMGLVTGNLTRIGWRKMQNAELRQYFSFGAFADQGDTRAELASIALGHARERGWLGAQTPAWLVGDHPNDVGAAKANGIRSIAVCTGLSTRDELSAHNPDILTPDLSAVRVATLLEAR
jgi:phosphoglycolate phosphatase